MVPKLLAENMMTVEATVSNLNRKRQSKFVGVAVRARDGAIFKSRLLDAWSRLFPHTSALRSP